MFIEDVQAILIDSSTGPLWNLLSEKADEEDIATLLAETLEKTPTGLKIPDIEAKFHLHAIHRKATLTRNIFSSIASLILLLIILLVVYICRKNLGHLAKCSKKNQQPWVSDVGHCPQPSIYRLIYG